MGRIDVSLQALSEFLQYTAVPVEGNATHAVHIFTSQWPGEHKVEEGKLLAGLPGKLSYGSLEMRNATNTVLVNLEKLTHAVGALCAYALNVDDGSENNVRWWAVRSISNLGTFLDYFQCWAQRVYVSIGIEGGRFSVDVTKFCIFDLAYVVILGRDHGASGCV